MGGISVTQVANSNMEAEYIVLSTGTRELVERRKLMKELIDHQLLRDAGISVISLVWEDNEASLRHVLTPLPKITPRTKHIEVASIIGSSQS